MGREKGEVRNFRDSSFLRRQTQGWGGAQISGIRISPQADAGCAVWRIPLVRAGSHGATGFALGAFSVRGHRGGVTGVADSASSVSGRRVILGTTEGLTSGVVDFPESGFSTSASSGRPRGWHFCGFRSSAKAASGTGVLAGFGAVFSGCHRDGRGGDFRGERFS